MAVATRVERASREGTTRFEREGLSKWPTLPSTPATKTCRRGPRFVAVGAGLEPAHALRREPRLQRGATPFRSPYQHKHSGGDDPIRTDGAFRVHSALAVRCLKPLGHVSKHLWWGWRDLNSHAQRHWFLRPACLPFPPHPHDVVTRNNLVTLPAFRFRARNLLTPMVGSQGLEP
jgi:hypothetical protein